MLRRNALAIVGGLLLTLAYLLLWWVDTSQDRRFEQRLLEEMRWRSKVEKRIHWLEDKLDPRKGVRTR